MFIRRAFAASKPNRHVESPNLYSSARVRCWPILLKKVFRGVEQIFSEAPVR